MPNPLYSDKLLPLAPVASQAKSLPFCLPTLLAAPNIPFAAIPILDHRIHASEAFIAGFQASGYTGDPSLVIDNKLCSGNGVRAMQQATILELRAQVARRGGRQMNTVSLEVYEGQGAGRRARWCVCVAPRRDPIELRLGVRST